MIILDRMKKRFKKELRALIKRMNSCLLNDLGNLEQVTRLDPKKVRWKRLYYP
jgi:hypothetical protein